MSTLPKLIPRTVMLHAEAKFFGLDVGRSDGSQAAITFDIPEGMTNDELKRAMLQEKERLDLFVLASERVKGSISQELFVKRREGVIAGYDTILKRKEPPKDDPTKS